MSHTVHILEFKKLSDGQFAIKTCCCGNEQHVSWHTMDASVLIDDAKREASITEHCAMMAQHHAAAVTAEAHLEKLAGTSREIIDVRSQ